MKRLDTLSMERRDFIAGVVPACVGCLGICAPITLSALSEQPAFCQQQHKFDEEIPPLTIRQYFSRVLGSGSRVLNAIRAEIGEEELIRILRDHSFNRGVGQGQSVAEQYPERDFFSYNERFRAGQMLGLTTYEILEDSEAAFEISVTECALVEPLLEADLGKVGNAWLCHADYGHAHGYNPKIELVRDQTLMLGDPCCNHRYVWTD